MRYDLGYGAGEGEEYSTIPGYEGRRGYFALLDILGRDWNLGEDFVHPDTGQVFHAVKWLGCECDDGYQYEIVC